MQRPLSVYRRTYRIDSFRVASISVSEALRCSIPRTTVAGHHFSRYGCWRVYAVPGVLLLLMLLLCYDDINMILLFVSQHNQI